MNEFINQAIIFIGTTVIIVPIFKLLGFGSVLGYLTAGIVVGPYSLGLIKDAESVMHFAELGVVFLLFIIGLEIQPKKLINMRSQLLGLGVVQILLTTLVFTGLGIWFGLDLTIASILAFGLSLSSTAFALQYLIEKNQFQMPFGQSSFAILLSQDLVAIPVLAIIPALVVTTSAGHSTISFATLGYFTLLIVTLIFSSRFLIRPFFRFIGATRSQELFTATTLLIVFGVAALTLKIGLSAALGTFIAGVLLADSEYRHELEANIDPFKSLLMGLFFISVGMHVSLPLLITKPFLIIGLTITYMFIKMIIIYGAGKANGLSHENSKLMSLAIGQGGEFAFVIFGMILTMNLISSEIIAILTAVITVSMAISPMLNMLNEYLLSRKAPTEPKYDEFQDEEARILIAGFGRFGQIFGRVLKSQGISFVAIDHDANQVESLRRFGHRVYFGDASRRDILEKAGIGKVKYLVIAIDDFSHALDTARIVHENYPHVKIFARARNRAHLFEYMEMGVKMIKRETFDSALAFTGDLLKELGISDEKTNQILYRFKNHDEAIILEQFKVHKDESKFINLVHEGQRQLEEVMETESKQSYL